LACFADRGFEFVKGSILDEQQVRQGLEGVEAVIHLAGIVGYPACQRDPRLAHEVNLEGTQLLERLRRRDQPILFASTGSNYGAVVGAVCTETTPLNPLSEYGVTKTTAERHLLEAGNVICYRFATAFGVSPRMRFDLLVNDFVYQAKVNKDLIVYERSFKRTFIHVRDMARAFAFALDDYRELRDDVYNVGSEEMNYSKEEVAFLIRKKVDYYLHFAEIGKDEDQRNYEVSYAKIEAKGFKTQVDMESGIEELMQAVDLIVLRNEYGNI
jgi:nucleoside-diphosphate-sugar epimerase